MPSGSRQPREARQLRSAAIAGFVLLTLLFTIRGCPRDEIEGRAIERLEAATGTTAVFEDVEFAFDWLTPKLRLRRGRLVWPDGETLEISYARMMPKTHWGWLIGRPRFALKVNTAVGKFRGWVSGHHNTISGTIEEVVLGDLPYERWGTGGLRLEGNGEVALSGSQPEGPWNGTVLFRAVNGTLTLPNTQLPIAFTLLKGRFDLSESHVELAEELVMEGPMGIIAAKGRVARGVPDPGLNLDLRFDLRDPTLLQALSAGGLRIRPGASQVHVGGTVSSPVARARSARRR